MPESLPIHDGNWSSLNDYLVELEAFKTGGSLAAGGSTLALSPSTGAITWTRASTTYGVWGGAVFMPDATGVEATDLANLNAAKALIPAAGGQIIFGVGDYHFGQNVTFTKRVKLAGCGSGSADHLVSAPTRLTFSSATDDGLVLSAGGIVEDLAVINSSGTESAGVGVKLVTSSYSRLNRVGVRGFYDNVSIDQSIYFQVEACHFLNCVRYGVLVQNTTVADAGDGFIGSGTAIYPRSTGSTSGIRWESSGGLKIEGVKINANGAGGFAKGIDAAIADGAATSVFIVDGSSIEGCTTTGISVTQQGTTGVFGKVILTANEIGVGATPTGIAVVSTTVGDITEVIITSNIVESTTNGIQVDGVNTLTVGSNSILGAQSDSGISIRNVAGGMIAPNTISGQWTNAAVNIKGSGTPSSSLALDHQNIITSSAGQTLILDSSASVVSSLKRNRIVYDEMRELGGTFSSYATQFQFLLPASIGIGGTLEFGFEGNVTGGAPTGDAFAIYGKRLLTLPAAGGAFVTAATVGADVVAGTAVDYTLDLATAATVKLQIRLNAAQGGTALHGQAWIKYNGTLSRLIRT